MQTIELPDRTYQQAEAFARVYRAVTGEDADVSICIQVLLERGFKAALGDILLRQDSEVLAESLQQIASESPAVICDYVANAINLGAKIQRLDSEAHRLGFSQEPSEK